MTVREPLYRRVPDCRTSFGDLAAAVGIALGLPPDAEQRSALDAIFAERAAGEPAARHAAIIGARQNIKTSTLEIAAAADLLVLGIPEAIWTAHESKTASKSYADLLPRLLGNPDFATLIDYRGGRGEERIFLLDDPAVSLEYRARSGGSGRGFTTSRITLDEALYLRAGDMGALLPTMLTRRDAQVRYGSSGGFAFSEVLRSLRDRAKAGTDPRLFYVEYGAERRSCQNDNCTHIWGVEGCALDDRELWWQANCALWSGRVDEENILDLRRSMPWQEFAREVLVWWDDPLAQTLAIDLEKWASRADPTSNISGKPFMAVSMTPDRRTVSLAASGKRQDGRYHVEIIRHGPAGEWFVRDSVDIARRQNADLLIAPSHPVGSLLPEFEKRFPGIRSVSAADYVRGCGAFSDGVNDGTLTYLPPQPELDDAVIRATKKPVGDAFRWAGDDISALVAASQALYAAKVPQGGWMVAL